MLKERCFLCLNTGMRIFRKKSVYVLMHKDIEVLKADYDIVSHQFSEIIEICNEAHVPVGCRKHGDVALHRLNYWYIRRSIPGYRVGLRNLSESLHISHPMDLVEYTHAVSLSDTYWLRKEEENIAWKDVCFYHQMFDPHGFATASFSITPVSTDDSAKYTPGNNTAGFHRKAWFPHNDNMYLYKGGYPGRQLEPVNEWLAYTLGTRLGMHVLPYTTGVYNNALVSICPSMCDDSTDLVTAEMILLDCDASKDDLQFNTYIHELEKHGIRDVRNKLSDMIMLDYILMNTDRHSQNMGILVNSDTNAWMDITPVFDTGTCLGCLVEDNEILSDVRQYDCTLMNRRHFDYDQLLDYVNPDLYDFTDVLDIPRTYGNELVRYQNITGISDDRIENTYTLLYKQLLKIRKIARNRKLHSNI